MHNDSPHHYALKIDGIGYTAEHAITTGAKLLSLTGKPAEDFLVALRVPSEPEQLIGAEEEFDLSAPGAEHFVTIERHQHYSLRVDETTFRVRERYIDGRQILQLAGKPIEDHFIVQRIAHADDIVIALEQRVDLAKPGTERFDVVKKPVEPLYIIIDEVRYFPQKNTATGQELRNLTNPPIPLTRDLWLDVPGKDDLKIAPTQTLTLTTGMVFYTAPATINPGTDRYATH